MIDAKVEAAAQAAVKAIQALEVQSDKLREKGDIVALVRLMDSLHDSADRLGEVKAQAQKLYDRVRFSHLPDLMDQKDIRNLTVDGIGQCYLSDDLHVSTGDKDAVKAWLIEQGLEDMITESVNANTLSAFVKRRLKAGEPLPTDLFTIRPFVRAAIKAK